MLLQAEAKKSEAKDHTNDDDDDDDDDDEDEDRIVRSEQFLILLCLKAISFNITAFYFVLFYLILEKT